MTKTHLMSQNNILHNYIIAFQKRDKQRNLQVCVTQHERLPLGVVNQIKVYQHRVNIFHLFC